MISILYKHSSSNYITLRNGIIGKITSIDKIDESQIWVTNIPKIDIKNKNIKNIDFFGTTFGEIINNFGYNALGTIEKLTIVLDTVIKIISKVETEHRINLTHSKIESMKGSIIDFYTIKNNLNDSRISNLILNDSPLSISFSEPKSKHFNISYIPKYSFLNRLKTIYIPSEETDGKLKNKKTKTINVYICNIKPKENILNVRKAIFFSDLIGLNVVVFENELKTLSDIYKVDIINRVSYSSKILNLGVDFKTPDNSFSEYIYCGLVINKIKSTSKIISRYIQSIERLDMYNDIKSIDGFDGIKLISAHNNNLIIERDFNEDINLKKIKTVINLNISLIVKNKY